MAEHNINEVRHWHLNPTDGAIRPTGLQRVTKTMEAEGFALVRIVHYTQYEAVAVFERKRRNNGYRSEDISVDESQWHGTPFARGPELNDGDDADGSMGG